MPHESFHSRWLVLSVTLLCILFSFASPPVKAQQTGKKNWSVFVNAGSFFGKLDKEDIYFDAAVDNIKHAGASSYFGLEYQVPTRFGIRPQFGYQRIFYSNIGIEQITKNYYLGDLLFTYHFNGNVKRWDPYLFAGPNLMFSQAGKQAYLKTGAGILLEVRKNWAVRLETTATTAFDGIRGEFATGLAYRF